MDRDWRNSWSIGNVRGNDWVKGKEGADHYEETSPEILSLHVLSRKSRGLPKVQTPCQYLEILPFSFRVLQILSLIAY